MITNETYQLADGASIPKLGLGTWLIDDDKAAQAVRDAVECGYRFIDTAQAYGNEAGVGEGVRTASVPRDQLFVGSKIAAEIKDYDGAKRSIDETLSKMGLDYLDQIIIHSPEPWGHFHNGSNHYYQGNLEVWRALEEAKEVGKVREIGVSNFLEDDLENIIDNSSEAPAVNQILFHVGHTPRNLVTFCQAHNILVEAYSPVAHGALLHDSQLEAMAGRYGVSVPQLCIRYVIQCGAVALPKTANPEHMRANAQLDFVISGEDMDYLAGASEVDYGADSAFPVFSGR